jgi:hypothetical protein
MKRHLPLLSLLIAASSAAVAQPSCPGGRVVAEYGYEFVSCVGCLTVTRVGGLEYTAFSSEPVLHRIKPDGPGANKLRDSDTLVAVDGYPITSVEAAIRFSDWQPNPVELTLRNGGIRHVIIRANPLCWPDRPFSKQLTVPSRARIGVAVGCDGCRVQSRPGSAERWVYLRPPVLVAIEPGGPGDRAGLRANDTLTLVDGFSIESATAGDRIGDPRPGRPMQWTVRRNGVSRTVTIVPELPPPSVAAAARDRIELTVSGTRVRASGKSVRSARDEKTGMVTIYGDSLTVTIRPPDVR